MAHTTLLNHTVISKWSPEGGRSGGKRKESVEGGKRQHYYLLLGVGRVDGGGVTFLLSH